MFRGHYFGVADCRLFQFVIPQYKRRSLDWECREELSAGLWKRYFFRWMTTGILLKSHLPLFQLSQAWWQTVTVK